MIESNEGALLIMPAASAATTATQSMVFETPGYSHANIYVLVGTHATNGEAIRACALKESDTVTSHSSMSAIVAFTGGSETSTSVAFEIPGPTLNGPGAIMEFQVDLRKRKKYMALVVTPGTTTMYIAAMGRLTRATESDDSAAQKSAVTNHALTSATQCSKVIAG